MLTPDSNRQMDTVVKETHYKKKSTTFDNLETAIVTCNGYILILAKGKKKTCKG